jgi:ribonuclease P protein component
VDAGGFRIYRREKPEGLSRLGLSVSRQVGSAVHRNRVKRAVREWFRASGAKFRRPADILVVFRKEVPEALVKKLAEKLDRAFAF